MKILQSSGQRTAIPAIVEQHLEEAATLQMIRAVLIGAPHLNLKQLQRLDGRLAAHIDGLVVANADAVPACEASLESLDPGKSFAVAILALHRRDNTLLQRAFNLAESDDQCRDGLLAAFGWAEQPQLQGTVRELLISTASLARLVGVAACSMHRVDPALGPARRLEEPDLLVRARAYRAAGELGKREFVSRLATCARDEDSVCQFWAAWSAVLLGDRQNALELLGSLALQDGPFRARAFTLALLAMSPATGHQYLRPLSQDPAWLRWLLKGVGIVGDPIYVPWLLRHMADDPLARVAGESFTLITGLDLSRPPFERARPDNFESGPTDDPADENVAMDEDEGLPWTDLAQVKTWWDQNGGRLATGVRHFLGQPVTQGHCIDVLKTGYQRQRIAAAIYLSLLNPGTPLFEWRAPAWRQQRLLAAMT
jgi:uncharacterized protein (TIGR02270 family)